jgi:hypothetical protein
LLLLLLRRSAGVDAGRQVDDVVLAEVATGAQKVLGSAEGRVWG